MGCERRQFTKAVSAAITVLFCGCSGISTGGGSTEIPTSAAGTPAPDDTTTDPPPETETDVQSVSLRTVPVPETTELRQHCVTDRFDGFTGTTPVPPPRTPAEVTASSVTEYALAYEEYYQRYQALYEFGSPTPESDGLPAHGFPDVRINVIDRTMRDTNDGWLVGLSFSFSYELSKSGEYADQGTTAVVYYVNEETVARSDGGDDAPADSPWATGAIVDC